MNHDTTPTPRTDAVQRITDYLLSGGLFNPELAMHDRVRDLLMDCRTELAEKTNEVSNWHRHYRDEASKAQKCKQAYIEQEKEVARLRAAAQAVVDRWETPLWKDAEPTASVIYRLRDALAPEPEETITLNNAQYNAQ
jgi:hypothetical protein